MSQIRNSWSDWMKQTNKTKKKNESRKGFSETHTCQVQWNLNILAQSPNLASLCLFREKTVTCILKSTRSWERSMHRLSMSVCVTCQHSHHTTHFLNSSLLLYMELNRYIAVVILCWNNFKENWPIIVF